MSSRVERERQTLILMISDYCHGHHRDEGLCPACIDLRDYAVARLNRCPFGEGKTTCAKCPVHCYRKGMREKIRAVMRYAGPRMAYRHPYLALRHFLDRRRETPIQP